MKKYICTMIAAIVVASMQYTVVSALPYCGITWGSLPKEVNTMSTVNLTNVRTGQHECYDRMVFDFNGNVNGYHVEYVPEVYADGSGMLIPLAGAAKLQIVVRAPAYDTAGNPTYAATVNQQLPGVNLAGYQTFRQAKYAGSFEGQTTVGLGVRARLPFRVFTLENRIVVDVAHRW